MHTLRQLSKIGVRDFADGWVYVEIVLVLEAECSGDYAAGEHLALVAIVSHVTVVEAPCRLDSVFGVDQFLLQLEEIAVGFELRVVFHHRQHLLQGVDQLALVGLLVDGSLTGHALGAKLSDALEDLLFVGRVAFDRRNKVGDKIVAALEFGVDVAPRIADVVSQSNQRVVRKNDVHDRNEDDSGDYSKRHPHSYLPENR